jgi:hypothetical protein
MEPFLGDPESTRMGWVQGSDLLDVFENEVGILL